MHPCNSYIPQIQVIQQPQTTDQHTAPRGRDTEHAARIQLSKATSSLFLSGMVAKLERTLTAALQNKDHPLHTYSVGYDIQRYTWREDMDSGQLVILLLFKKKLQA